MFCQNPNWSEKLCKSTEFLGATIIHGHFLEKFKVTGDRENTQTQGLANLVA